jgi:hypothetical protein
MSSLEEIDWKAKVAGHIHGVPKFILAVNSAFMKREMRAFLLHDPLYEKVRDTDSNSMIVSTK